jgi:carbamate kinase
VAEAKKLAVVAFGGNALLRSEDRGTQEEQIARAKQAARWLAEIVRAGYKLIVVHGNGPQVGNILVQAEEASTKIPPQSLDVAVAQTEGSIGFMLQQAIRNRLESIGLGGDVTTVLTEVEVDPGDVAFKRPTKPIGPVPHSLPRGNSRARSRMDDARRRGTGMAARRSFAATIAHPEHRDDPAHAGYRRGRHCGRRRRDPRGARTRRSVAGHRSCHRQGLRVSPAGGESRADVFVILTAVAKFAIDFGKPAQKNLDQLTVAEAESIWRPDSFQPARWVRRSSRLCAL